jgi:hypothetical protein
LKLSRHRHWMAALAMGIGASLAAATALGLGFCHAKRSVHIFEWGCLLPVTTLMTSVGFVVLVPLAVLFERRFGAKALAALPLVGGIIAQTTFLLWFVTSAGNTTATAGDILTLPMPFLAGALSALAYSATAFALRGSGRLEH